MKIKTVIIDDEAQDRRFLSSIVHEMYTDHLEIIGEADGARAGVELIKKLKPNLVFLDIQMTDGTGFDVLNELEDVDFEVIFVTGYDQYALKAFEASALGYILKPVKRAKLEEAVNKSIQIRKGKSESGSSRIKVLVENYQNHAISKMVIRHESGFEVLTLDEIIYLRGDGSYTHFVTTDNTNRLIASKNIGSYDKLLSDFGFFRIHQKTLVNLAHVKRYSKEDGGTVVMDNGDDLPLSRHRKSEFLNTFLQP